MVSPAGRGPVPPPAQPPTKQTDNRAAMSQSNENDDDDEDDNASSDDDFDGWPGYVLRVGIESIQQVRCEPGSNKTFHVQVNCNYVVSRSCQLVEAEADQAEQWEGAPSKWISTARPPPLRSTLGLADSAEASDKMARKIGLLMMAGVQESTIADVLDIDKATMMKTLGVSIEEKAGVRDIIIEEAHLFYLKENFSAEDVEVTIEAFSNANVDKKDTPVGIGEIKVKLSDLVDLSEVARMSRTYGRIQWEKEDFEGASGSHARLKGELQLWRISRTATIDMRPRDQMASIVADRESLLEMERKNCTKTVLSIEQANNLRNVDLFGGKSDPYCIVSIKRKHNRKTKFLFKTEVIDNDPDPVWNDGPRDVTWGDMDTELVFEVYDKDFGSKGDLLGSVTLPRKECMRGIWTDLSLGDGNGTLRVKIVPWYDQENIKFQPPPPRPKIMVRIVSGHNLKAVNRFAGKSDPYVVCTFSKHKSFRTEVINHTLNPVWNHAPEYFTLESEQEITFEVRDRDLVGSKYLGLAKLPREKFEQGFDDKLSLGQGAGKLHVEVLKIEPGEEPKPRTIRVTVISAHGLRNTDWVGLSDPYVVCKLDNKIMFKTPVIQNNLDPVWNDGPHEFQCLYEKDLNFEIFDKDLVGHGDLLGMVRLDVRKLPREPEHELHLGHGKGSLRVRIEMDWPVAHRGDTPTHLSQSASHFGMSPDMAMSPRTTPDARQSTLTASERPRSHEEEHEGAAHEEEDGRMYNKYKNLAKSYLHSTRPEDAQGQSPAQVGYSSEEASSHRPVRDYLMSFVRNSSST
mmetsp:Transcript_12921/g.33241  ORF Transcript_12921/g.33241 Transcript_12921/m.33241 type:complete len:798 (+) Transcript_12921:137-2530(+)